MGDLIVSELPAPRYGHGYIISGSIAVGRGHKFDPGRIKTPCIMARDIFLGHLKSNNVNQMPSWVHFMSRHTCAPRSRHYESLKDVRRRQSKFLGRRLCGLPHHASSRRRLLRACVSQAVENANLRAEMPCCLLRNGKSVHSDQAVSLEKPRALHPSSIRVLYALRASSSCDAPLHLIDVYSQDIIGTVFAINCLCVIKFMWICSKPTGPLYLYDKVRRHRIMLPSHCITRETS